MKAIVNGFNDSTSKWVHYSFDLYLRYLDAFQRKKKNYIFLSFYIPFLLFSHIHYFHFYRTTKLPLTLQFKHRHLKRERVKKCKRIKISCALLTATEKNCFKPNVRAYRH